MGMMTPRRTFCLRSTLEPPPSPLPALILASLSLITILGGFVSIAALAI